MELHAPEWDWAPPTGSGYFVCVFQGMIYLAHVDVRAERSKFPPDYWDIVSRCSGFAIHIAYPLGASVAAALMGIRVSLALGSAILASVAAHASAVFCLIVGALTGGWVQWALAHQGSNPFAALFVYCIAPLVGGVAIAHVLCPIPVLRGKNYGPNCMIILSLCVILGAAFWLVAGQTSARLNSLYVIPGAAIVIHLMLLSVFTHSRVRAQFK